MPIARSLIGRLAPAVALLAGSLALAAPSGAGTPTDPDPMTGAPAAGTCYDIGIAEISQQSTDQATVDCSTEHTTWVLGAVEAPSNLDVSSYSPELGAFAQKSCRPLVAEAIGGQLARQLLSNYESFFLAPTQSQIDAGAHWISCELTMLEGTGLLRTGTAKLQPLTSPLKKSVARCLNGKLRPVPCSEKHAHKAVYAKVIGSPYTEKRLRKAAATYCPKHVGRRYSAYGYRFVAAMKSGTFGLA